MNRAGQVMERVIRRRECDFRLWKVGTCGWERGVWAAIRFWAAKWLNGKCAPGHQQPRVRSFANSHLAPASVYRYPITTSRQEATTTDMNSFHCTAVSMKPLQ